MNYETIRRASPETMFSRDIGKMDTADIADFYVLGFMLQQAHDTDDPTTELAQKKLANDFTRKVHELTLAGVTTLGRELLGFAFTLGGEDISNDNVIQTLADELDTDSNPFLTEETVALYDTRNSGTAHSIQTPRVIGATLTGLHLAAFEALKRQDFNNVTTIASMTGYIAAELFAAIGRCDWSGRYTQHDDPQERASKKVNNWLHFGQLVQQVGEGLSSDNTPEGTLFSIVDQMIHAQHGGSFTKASMLDRSAIHPSEAKLLLDSKDFSTHFLIERFTSESVRSLAAQLPELSPFSENKIGILGSAELSMVSGKARGLHILKLLGYKVPPFRLCRYNDATQWAAAIVRANDGDESTQWAVRSSANLEDSLQHSFAGMFTTVLDVGHDGLTEAIDRVRDSGYTPSINSYCIAQGIDPHELKLDYIIQEFKEPIWSGVWVGGEHGGLLEWIEGRGEHLVNGLLTPHHEQYGHDTAVLKDEHGRAVSEICREIESRVGARLDLEFAMTEDGLQWVQLRPVTATTIESTTKHEYSETSLIGRGISKGMSRGTSFMIDESFDPTSLPDEDLVFVGANAYDDRWMQIPHVVGIVTQQGGALSHVAIIARELGIPYVSEIEIKKIPAGAIIEVDGTSGAVTPQISPKFTLRALANRIRRRGNKS